MTQRHASVSNLPSFCMQTQFHTMEGRGRRFFSSFSEADAVAVCELRQTRGSHRHHDEMPETRDRAHVHSQRRTRGAVRPERLQLLLVTSLRISCSRLPRDVQIQSRRGGGNEVRLHVEYVGKSPDA